MSHVLVVDDDARMLALIERALAGYQITAVQDGEAALSVAARPGVIDLLITDYLMPTMMGDELVGRMREARPQLKVLIVTGYGAILEREVPEWWNAEAHLEKPFGLDVLREKVVGLIGRPPAAANPPKP